MHSTYANLLAATTQLLTAIFLLNVPSEFWTQLIEILDVPEVVKVAVAPFFGSACATAVEYLASPKTIDHKRWHWPLKLFVGWVAGTYGGGGAQVILKGEPETLAFWCGVLGYGSVALALYKQTKEKDNDDGSNTPVQP